jgi:hypothetical protein
MEAQLFTIPWGNPREAEIEPKPRSMPCLEHSTVEEMIAEQRILHLACGHPTFEAPYPFLGDEKRWAEVLCFLGLVNETKPPAYGM